jgi:WhiB family redox-sensing transcriptional regulator
MTPQDLLRDMRNQPDWYRDAVCAQADPEAWYPEQGGSTVPAKRICLACPVAAECLAYALAHQERFGVWGGLSPRERQRLQPTDPSRLGKPRVDLTPEQEQIAAAMFAAGATVNQISVQTGAGHRAVDRFLAKLNQNGAAA